MDIAQAGDKGLSLQIFAAARNGGGYLRNPAVFYADIRLFKMIVRVEHPRIF